MFELIVVVGFMSGNKGSWLLNHVLYEYYTGYAYV